MTLSNLGGRGDAGAGNVGQPLLIEIGLTRTQADADLYESLLLPPGMMVMNRHHLCGIARSAE